MFVVHADYRQFSLRDKASHQSWLRTHPRRDVWTDEAVTRHRIGAEPHSLSIGTARSDLVEVIVNVGDTPPAVLADADHVVEADLDVPSGELSLFGPADYPGQQRHLPVAPGRYRVRVSYLQAGPPDAEWNDFEYGDHLRYVLDLWPVPAASDLVVLKQGGDLWDG
ncbi:hypothetical protein ACFWY9_17355 [Amycolatopsis sp. NPDC059027]|uniref:hypothetical protein n=1 Tax=unclassified Amycolatopsis TaxID=2618356 RepID=UPI003672A396